MQDARVKLILLWTVGVFLFFFGHSLAQSQVIVTVVDQVFRVGERARIPVLADCGDLRCSSFEVILSYDPGLLRIHQIILGESFAEGLIVDEVIDDQVGEVRISLVVLGDAGLIGRGILFELEVEALDVGSTEIIPLSVEIGDLEPYAVSVDRGMISLEIADTGEEPVRNAGNRSVAFMSMLDIYLWLPPDGRGRLTQRGENYEPDVFDTSVLFSSLRDNNDFDIFVYDLTTNTERRLTIDPAKDRHPIYSPDGNRIAFSSDRGGNWDIYVMEADGGNQRAIVASPSVEYFPAWSSDGQSLVYQSDKSGSYEFYWFDIQTQVERQITNADSLLAGPVLSPDDRWIVGYADTDNRYWVLIRVSDGLIMPGTSGVATDWIDAETFLFHRQIADERFAILTYNIETNTETQLIDPGVWASNYP